MRRHEKAMTVIEMLIVCMIIGILASIAILTMATTRKRAICTEAITALSSIKQAMKYYYAEYGCYQDLNGFLNPTDPDPYPTYPQGIVPGFINGSYFPEKCYKIEASNERVKCFPALSDNRYTQLLAEGANPDEAYIALSLDGSFTQHYVSGSCYPSE